MSRKLKFDLNVETNALLCPNPDQFYVKAYIPSADIVNNFRALPGIKYKSKLANILFANDLLKASTCSFSAGTDPIDAIDIDVCPISAMAEICQFDIEQSFLALQMASGSNGNQFEVASFMSFYWEQMAERIGNDIEILRWQGDGITTGGAPNLALCVGHEHKLAADPDVVHITATTVTASNVITEMNKVYSALTPVLQTLRDKLRFYVSANVYAAYLQAAFTFSNANIFAVSEAVNNMTYLGIKIVESAGMSNNTMALTLQNNLVYAFDAEGDGKAIKAVNMADTTAEPFLRSRANLKIGFFHTNPTEIVFYTSLPVS